MFQIQDLCESTSDHAIRQTLKDLPRGLYETYQRKLEKITVRRRSDLAQKIFRWISIAVRPLHLAEIQEAVTFDENDTFWSKDKLPHPDALIASCENLIIFDDTGGLSFAHHTVRNFLLSTGLCTLNDSFHFSLTAANIFAAKICVAYLFFTDFETQVVKKPRTVVDTQSLNPLRNGGLTHLTSSLEISDKWFNLPYRLLGGRRHNISDNINLGNEGPHSKVSVPTSLNEKYRFLNYAAQNWLFHSQHFMNPQKPKNPAKDVTWRTLENFGLLATERVMVFNHKNWDVQSSPREFPFQTMFSWAMEHNHIPLLWQLGELGSAVQGPRLRAYLIRNSFKVARVLRTTCIEGQDVFLRFIIGECSEDDPARFLCEAHLVWCASLNGHQSIVKILLDIGISIEAKVSRPDYIPADVELSPARALELAVLKGHTDVVKVLLEHRANVDVYNTEGHSPMHYVPNAEIVRLLLERGAKIDARTRGVRKYTPLHSAVIAGREAVVEKLLHYNASATMRDGSQKTALDYTNDVAIARMILDSNRHVTKIADDEGNTALLSAASEGNLDLVILLCVYGAFVNAVNTKGNTALLHAASYGHPDIIQYLCGQGASMTSINHLGNTALHEACAADHREAVEALLAGAYGIPQIDAKNSEGQTPWSLAISKGHADIVRVLMQAGVTEPDPLHLAAIYGRTKVIDVLLDLGLSIDSEDQHGETTLFLSVERGRASTVRFLLKRQASVNGRSHDLFTALMVAASKVDIDFRVRKVQILLEAGADVNLRNVRDETALFLAIERQNYATARMLMAGGADPTIISRPKPHPRSWQRPLQALQAQETRPTKYTNYLSKAVSNVFDDLTACIEGWISEHPNHFTDQIEPEVWIQMLRRGERSALRS